MPLVPLSADYTDKDFDSIRFRLRNLIRSVFPEWTDFNVANFGNILLELFAHTGDILTFYQDNQARQSRITTATQRQALLGLVKIIGYTPATATAATADVTITLEEVPVGEVVFPKGTFVKTEEVTDPIKYQLLDDLTIDAGADPPSGDVSCEHSETKTFQFVSTGLANQTFALDATPFIDGSVVLIADNGSYTQVDNFLDSTPTDRHFTITVDQNDRAIIKTGNGVNGAVPVGTLIGEYKIGGGSAGRVQLGKLKIVEGTFTDSLGNPVKPSASNASASSGGTDRQSVAQIKERAPASLRVLQRSVAREDFEINALRLTDVARALMLTSNEDAAVAENAGDLYVVPVGGGLPSTLLKDAVLEQVTEVYPCTLTFSVTVRDPVYKTVDVYAVVHFRKGVNKANAAQAIRDNLEAFFEPQNADGTANTNVDFGGNIKDSDGEITGKLALSDVFNIVRDTLGVQKVGPLPDDFLLNEEHNDVSLGTKEFPKLGTVELIDGDTGNTL